MGRVRATLKKPRPDFVIMNKDAMYFKGLKAGDILWTDNVKEAKVFNEPRKINGLKSWKPWLEPQIVYKSEL